MKTATKAPTKNALQMVEEIHRKVNTASSNRLMEAKELFQKTTPDQREEMEVLEKMQTLGFSNVKEVKEKNEEMLQRKLMHKRAELIMDYQVKYPDYKFITTEDMEAICKEYNLILGGDKQYTDSIPMRCMKQIVKFKLKEEDFIYSEGSFVATERSGNISTGTMQWKEISKADYLNKTNNGTRLKSTDNRNHWICNDNYFTIGAPENMFNIEGMVKDGVHLKEKITVTESFDPFCLKTVKFGYLILALWGEELAIQALNNEKHN